jgi:hypothetical protein
MSRIHAIVRSARRIALAAETARCASHMLPNRGFWEAIRVHISANILI